MNFKMFEDQNQVLKKLCLNSDSHIICIPVGL